MIVGLCILRERKEKISEYKHAAIRCVFSSMNSFPLGISEKDHETVIYKVVQI